MLRILHVPCGEMLIMWRKRRREREEDGFVETREIEIEKKVTTLKGGENEAAIIKRTKRE